MPRMIRKQVYIGPEQDRMLKRRARQRGVTEAEIIREALDRAALGLSSVRAQSAGLDANAGRKALSFIRSLAGRSSKGPAGRSWTREALYEDRIGRWARS